MRYRVTVTIVNDDLEPSPESIRHLFRHLLRHEGVEDIRVDVGDPEGETVEDEET